MAGVDMIGHLAEVESRTEELVLKAQSEARELVIEARTQGEVRYNECHGQIRASVKGSAKENPHPARMRIF